MKSRVLLTTTSFQDTPGKHHPALEQLSVEVVRERGPLPEARMLELAGDFDYFLCGDDAITRKVLEASRPRLKGISKYGIGLDKIDLAAATEMRIPVTNCPGVNHTTVAEHAFALMLALSRHMVESAVSVRNGQWKRLTGNELMGKTIGIAGMGRIGREVAVRARAFGMEVAGMDAYWDEAFAAAHAVRRVADIDELIAASDVITLHVPLTNDTRHLINAQRLARMRPGALLINTARGEVVDTAALAAALREGRLGGYGADVLEEEPPPPDHPLLNCPRTVITPHIGSRTHESVQRQAMMSVENLSALIDGRPPKAQANSF